MRSEVYGPPRALLFRVLIALPLTAGMLACEDEWRGPHELSGELEVFPTTVDFQGVPLGDERSTTIRILNYGQAPLVLESPGLVAGFPGPFEVERDRVVVDPSDSAQLTVRFHPADAGPAQAMVRILADHGPRRARTITLRGTGLTDLVEITPRVADFQGVRIGTPAYRTVRVHNPHDVAVEVEVRPDPNTRICGGPSTTPFCIAQSGGRLSSGPRLSLEPHETVVLGVDFRPTRPGVVEVGSFELAPCDGPACRVSFEGRGVARNLRCIPDALDFGAVHPGDCLGETVTCENVAGTPLRVLGWALDEADDAPSPFSIPTSTAVALAPGASADVDLDFCPTALGPFTGRLAIEADVQDQPVVPIALAGVGGGPDIEVSPAHCDFGHTTLSLPASCVVRVRNRGFDPLVISDLVSLDEDSIAITSTITWPRRIRPGTQEAIRLMVRPQRPGTVASAVRILSNDRGRPALDLPVSGHAYDLPSCVFRVSGGPVDFGAVRVPQVARRAVHVDNRGPHPCLLHGVALAPETGPSFSLPARGAAPQIIAAGATHRIAVDFAPLALGAQSGELRLSLSSADPPEHRVSLSGRGVDAGPLVTPHTIDFGAVQADCRSPARPLRIDNSGGVPLTLEVLELESDAPATFELAAPLELPLTLPDAEGLELEVRFNPRRTSPERGAIRVAGTLDGAPFQRVVSLLGSGVAERPWREDLTPPIAGSKVDVLFALDFTGSMFEEQTALARHADALTSFGARHSIDYQIGVTTIAHVIEAGRLMDPDRIRGTPFGGPASRRVIDARTQPDPASALRLAFQARNLSGGVHVPSGALFSAYLALTPPALTGHNAGFLRRDAALSIVFVTDEPEGSFRHEGAVSEDPAFYAEFLRSLKAAGSVNRVTVSAIAAEPRTPSYNYFTCSGPGGNAYIGARYPEIVRRTGGALLSICTDDWPALLENLAPHAFGLRTRVFLSTAPDVDTLRVFFGGVPIPRISRAGTPQWTYDSTSHAVVFSPFAGPEPSDQIRLRYRPASDCN